MHEPILSSKSEQYKKGKLGVFGSPGKKASACHGI